MAKRGSSGLSLMVGIDKPAGMSSHDVVNVCRRVFGERRVGHTGTLDPAATGAMAVCVGPATRLDRFLAGHRKTYLFSIVFGESTDTDDAEGDVIATAAVPDEVFDEAFARAKIAELIGDHKQMPPVYSAIKVNGRKSYDEARKGRIIDLASRDITIYHAELVSISTQQGACVWECRCEVSGGTYVRSIARDIGHACSTVAHVGYLRREVSGNLDVRDCVSIDALKSDPEGALIDPVRLLGMRFMFADEQQADDVSCGRVLPAKEVKLFAYEPQRLITFDSCSCTSGVIETEHAIDPDEFVAIIHANKLQAIYRYDVCDDVLKSECGFAIGVKRECDIGS